MRLSVSPQTATELGITASYAVDAQYGCSHRYHRKDRSTLQVILTPTLLRLSRFFVNVVASGTGTPPGAPKVEMRPFSSLSADPGKNTRYELQVLGAGKYEHPHR